jgi:hypothetical protein
MYTRKVKMLKRTASCAVIAHLVRLRTESADEFIENHASGTLRKNKRVGLAWRSQYLHERAAHEFGYAFECLPISRVTRGKAQTEGDCKPLTEVGWHCERYLARKPFPEDEFEACYLYITDPDGKPRQGVGLMCTQTSASWVPDNHCIFVIIAEFDTVTKQYRAAVNPF